MKKAAAIVVFCAVSVFAQEAKLYRLSRTVEKERPVLGEETRELIAKYRRNPTEENRAALRKQVGMNYDKVLAKKKAKLEELKRTARHTSKVQEMQDIVDEMIATREKRIDQSMARFTDKRFGPADAGKNETYLPLRGAGEKVYIARFPVTQKEWAEFSGKPVATGMERHPAVNVSLEDVREYCRWLGSRDSKHTYRLPTAEEWELAAGHMPKDADFNCGIKTGTTPVDEFAKTTGACGGCDFWGNCWEWTSTEQDNGRNIVKGGAFDAKRTECRTEATATTRNAAKRWKNVTARIVREKKN